MYKPSLLIIEDSMPLCLLYKTLLEKEYDTHIVRDLGELKAFSPHIDLDVVITDYDVRVANFKDVLRILLTHFPKARRFMVTASANFSQIYDSYHHLFEGIYQKPFDIYELKNHILNKRSK